MSLRQITGALAAVALTLLMAVAGVHPAAEAQAERFGQQANDHRVQPVAIVYTRLHGMPMGRRHRARASWIGDQSLVPHLAGLLREGGIDVELHFGEPVAFGLDADRKQVAREVENRVKAMVTAALRN